MIRSLYTSSSGMKTQQFRLDVISNNLANVNTNGFKKSRVDFQDLIYQQLSPATQNRPTGIDVGTGARVAGTLGQFQQGPLLSSENSLDVGIEGKGFFMVELPNDITGYTRNGAFRIDEEGILVTSDGYKVLDDGGGEIEIPEEAQEIIINSNGQISVIEAGDTEPNEIATLGLTNFINPAGLEKMGSSIFLETVASGDPQEGAPEEDGFGSIRQYYLEGSNVQVVDEMVDMITTQRAYELNTKMIQTSDEILGMTNNLKR